MFALGATSSAPASMLISPITRPWIVMSSWLVTCPLMMREAPIVVMMM